MCGEIEKPRQDIVLVVELDDLGRVYRRIAADLEKFPAADPNTGVGNDGVAVSIEEPSTADWNLVWCLSMGEWASGEQKWQKWQGDGGGDGPQTGEHWAIL